MPRPLTVRAPLGLPPAMDHVSVAQRILDVAEVRPDHPAVVSPGTSWTFAELADRVRAVAAGVRDLGVPPGTPVGLLVGQDAAGVAALIGLTGAGPTPAPPPSSTPATTSPVARAGGRSTRTT
ncbi:MAG TPA: AMP-binding protein [Nocardioides sp.]